MTTSYYQEIRAHYETVWANRCVVTTWKQGPVSELPGEFCILTFSPTPTRSMWTYATCGMSQPTDPEPTELHLFSQVLSELHVELLTAIAHYHRTSTHLGIGHTVNFGRSWLPGSTCHFGLISLPYLDGPALEQYYSCAFECWVRFLWLIPITAQEREYKKVHGLEALESRFEEAQVNYLDPDRRSVV